MPCRSFARRLTPHALILASLLTACVDREAERALADSTLARDLALVQSSGAPQPIFRDTALTNAPAPPPRPTVRPTPIARPAARVAPARAVTRSRQRDRAVPPRERRRPTEVVDVPSEPDEPTSRVDRAGESRSGSIGAGSVLTASSNARVCTRSNLPGDPITATVNAPVRGTNGAEIPAGAKVVLEVASIDAAEPPAEGQVVFRVRSVAVGDESYPASGSATARGSLERVAAPRNAASDRKKVIGGAIAGAILGQMMGKDTRSTVIGAAAGAAAGTAAARMGDKGESCLPAGTALRITLDEAVVMH